MNIHLGAWTIPAVVTAVLLAVMNRPYRRSSVYDFNFVFRLLWLIPIALTWAVYFGVMLLIKP